MEVAYINRILVTTAILGWLNLGVFIFLDMVEDSKGITLLSENMQVVLMTGVSLFIISVSVIMFIVGIRGMKKEAKYE